MRKGVWEEGSWSSPAQSSAQPQKAPEIDQSKHKRTSSNSLNGYELRVFRFTWLKSTTNRLRLALLWMYSTPQPERPINKEIQMYQGKAPDKSRAVFALSHSIMNEQEVPEEARSPGKPWFAHFFSLCPSYFKSFLNYPLILHLSDPGSFFSVTSALMLAFSSSGTFFSLST